MVERASGGVRVQAKASTLQFSDDQWSPQRPKDSFSSNAMVQVIVFGDPKFHFG